MEINTVNLAAARSMLKTIKGKKIVRAQDSIFNRKLLELEECDVLVDIDSSAKKNTFRDLDCGLTPYLAKCAAKKGTAIGIDLANLRSMNLQKQGEKCAKLQLIVERCRKAGCKLALVNAKNEYGARAFLLSLGASTQQAAQALVF